MTLTPARLLALCALGTALAHFVIWRAAGVEGLSLIFSYLLRVYDLHGNLVLLGIVVAAYLLRRRPEALALVHFAAARPWGVAALMLLALCLGALRVYHQYPVSMDEYAALFQAKVFGAGELSGAFPPELVDRLIPRIHQNVFLTVSRSTGEVVSAYSPGFSLLLAPFAWLGTPWAANPAIAALSVPVMHRLALRMTGSRNAAGWAVLLTAASPAFVATSMSYYAMAGHLLVNAVYALLLLSPSVPRAFAAGLLGSLALTLHQPLPHLVFGSAFVVWLLLRRGSMPVLAALVVGYLPALALTFAWQQHLLQLTRPVQPAATSPDAPVVLDTLVKRLGALTLPQRVAIEARIAGLSKDWTWGAPGLLVLAFYGYFAARALPGVRVLGAALAVTFFAYFLFPFDQGHGWGNRYLYSAWFVLPLFAAVALADPPGDAGQELRAMAAWAVLLSLLVANGFRLLQVEGFISRQLAQVPPLTRAVRPGEREIVFIHPTAGFYTHDMVQNDPFLRADRVTMVFDRHENVAALMATRFPGYRQTEEGKWGQRWAAARDER
jgi:hypothetical protein